MQQSTEGSIIITSLVETQRYFFFEVIRNRKRQRLVLSKENQSFFQVDFYDRFLNAPVIKNDLDIGPNFWPDFSIQGKVLIKILYAEEIQGWRDSLKNKPRNPLVNKLHSITAEDNPVIMFVRTKS